MKKVIYFLLGIASLAVLLGMAYAGLSVAYSTILPQISFITPLVELYPSFDTTSGILTAIPVLIMTLYTLTYFFERSIKILFLILSIIAIAIIVLGIIGVITITI